VVNVVAAFEVLSALDESAFDDQIVAYVVSTELEYKMMFFFVNLFIALPVTVVALRFSPSGFVVVLRVPAEAIRPHPILVDPVMCRNALEQIVQLMIPLPSSLFPGAFLYRLFEGWFVTIQLVAH
jgi:hypothetical protein